MDRAEAERILAAHGWDLLGFDGDAAEVLFDVPKDGEYLVPFPVLRALDPDRPPSVAAIRRLYSGVSQQAGERTPSAWLSYLLDASTNQETAEALLARAWELGGEEPKP
jgi:hypothetical protein